MQDQINDSVTENNSTIISLLSWTSFTNPDDSREGRRKEGSNFIRV